MTFAEVQRVLVAVLAGIRAFLEALDADAGDARG